MKYVAVGFQTDTKKYGENVRFVIGYKGTIANAQIMLRVLMLSKEEQGIKVFNITKRSFETNEKDNQ